MKHYALFMGLLCVAAPAVAQQAPPGCTAAEHRQFDFWIGDWVVTDSAGGATYGTNLITREEGGCVLHEHWVGSRGGTGQSFNFYDRNTSHWVQQWVASTGNTLRLEGTLEGGAMKLEGAVAPAPGAMRNRIVWTPQPDGRVRQTWLMSTDNGATWKVSFDGWYKKK